MDFSFVDSRSSRQLCDAWKRARRLLLRFSALFAVQMCAFVGVDVWGGAAPSVETVVDLSGLNGEAFQVAESIGDRWLIAEHDDLQREFPGKGIFLAQRIGELGFGLVYPSVLRPIEDVTQPLIDEVDDRQFRDAWKDLQDTAKVTPYFLVDSPGQNDRQFGFLQCRHEVVASTGSYLLSESCPALPLSMFEQDGDLSGSAYSADFLPISKSLRAWMGDSCQVSGKGFERSHETVKEQKIASDGITNSARSVLGAPTSQSTRPAEIAFGAGSEEEGERLSVELKPARHSDLGEVLSNEQQVYGAMSARIFEPALDFALVSDRILVTDVDRWGDSWAEGRGEHSVAPAESVIADFSSQVDKPVVVKAPIEVVEPAEVAEVAEASSDVETNHRAERRTNSNWEMCDWGLSASGWNEGGNGRSNECENPGLWWIDFGDPFLGQLVAEVVSENPNAELAVARIAERRALADRASADRFPTISSKLQYDNRQFSQNGNAFLQKTPSTQGFDFYTAGLESRWELDLWGQLAARRNVSVTETQAAEFDWRDVRLSLIAEVVQGYIELCLVNSQIVIAKENAEVMKRGAEIAKARREAGLSGELDERLANNQYIALTAEIPALELNRERIINRLLALKGTTLVSNGRGLGGFVGELPEGYPDFPFDDIGSVLQRPDVRASQKRLQASGARIGVARKSLLPKLFINGQVSADTRRVDNWFTNESVAYNVGPILEWELLDFGRRRAGIKAAEADFLSAKAELNRVLTEACEEVRNALADLRRSREQAAILEQAVIDAKEITTMALVEYQEGIGVFQNVLDAQRQRIGIQENAAITRANCWLAYVRYYRAIGAGGP